MQTAAVNSSNHAEAVEQIESALENLQHALVVLTDPPAADHWGEIVASAKAARNVSPEALMVATVIEQMEGLCDRLNERDVNESRN